MSKNQGKLQPTSLLKRQVNLLKSLEDDKWIWRLKTLDLCRASWWSPWANSSTTSSWALAWRSFCKAIVWQHKWDPPPHPRNKSCKDFAAWKCEFIWLWIVLAGWVRPWVDASWWDLHLSEAAKVTCRNMSRAWTNGHRCWSAQNCWTQGCPSLFRCYHWRWMKTIYQILYP